MRLRGGGCGGSKSSDVTPNKGGAVDQLRNSLASARADPTAISADERKEAAQICAEWLQVLAVVEAEADKPASEAAAGAGEAAAGADSETRARKTSISIMHNAVKAETEAGELKKEARSLESTANALMQEARAVADDGREEKVKPVRSLRYPSLRERGAFCGITHTMLPRLALIPTLPIGRPRSFNKRRRRSWRWQQS